MPQLPKVTAKRRDVSADLEGQQLPWIPTDTEERKEEIMGLVQIPVLSGTVTHIPTDIMALHDMRTVYHALILVKSVIGQNCKNTTNCSNCEYHIDENGEGRCSLPGINIIVQNILENQKWRELFPWEVEDEKEEN